jgi:hypothetical protein
MGRQDMPDKYASDYVETYENMTEEEARRKWDEDVYGLLGTLITRMTESTTSLFPLRCPKCNSFKITTVFGTDRSLECLSCNNKFRIVDA